MKFSNILLLITLFLSAQAETTSFEFASLAEVSEISKTEYGESLLETVALTYKTSGNIETVLRLLDDLLFKLNKDQERADFQWNTELRRLNEKIERLTKQIEALRLEILALEAERAKYVKLVAKVKSNLLQYDQQLAQNLKQKVDLANIRSKDEADFKRSQDEHFDIINALNTVIKELKNLLGSISGHNKPTDVDEIAQETRDRLNKSFLEITKNEEEAQIFIEMATGADQKALTQLIDILIKLKNSTMKSYNDDKNAEERSVKTFKNLTEILTVDISKLNSLIIISRKNLVEYQKKISLIEGNIDQKTKLRNLKLSELRATEKEKETKQKQYEDDKAERSSEAEIIRKLQHIVNTRLANMSKYLRDQTNA